ncbi:hypothetical protein BD779DRAFT_1679158 [Infundibulicybe gibba]|nr:hypothetical protein BD779DRAFT_1679158 [Infundibulicybe gibba]
MFNILCEQNTLRNLDRWTVMELHVNHTIVWKSVEKPPAQSAWITQTPGFSFLIARRHGPPRLYAPNIEHHNKAATALEKNIFKTGYDLVRAAVLDSICASQDRISLFRLPPSNPGEYMAVTSSRALQQAQAAWGKAGRDEREGYSIVDNDLHESECQIICGVYQIIDGDTYQFSTMPPPRSKAGIDQTGLNALTPGDRFFALRGAGGGTFAARVPPKMQTSIETSAMSTTSPSLGYSRTT